MFRKWAHGLVIGLLLGSLFVAFPAAQNYIWSSINGVPLAPGLVMTNGGVIKTGSADGSTFSLSAYDTDLPGQVTLLTLTAGTTPSMTGLFGAGSAAAPGVAVGEAGTGLMNDAPNKLWAVAGGNLIARFALGGFLLYTGDIFLGSGADLALTRESAATLQLGTDAAGTIAQTIKSNDRITSDGVGGDLTIAAGRGRGAAGGSLYFQTAAAAGAGVDGTLATRLIIAPTGAITAGASAGTGAGAFYAGSYFVGTTAGADCTSAGAVTTVKGIVTVCSEPIPDPLTQSEINELRGLLAQPRPKQ